MWIIHPKLSYFMRMKNICNYTSVTASYKWEQVLNDFNFTINSNEFWVILGKNGSGKSLIGQLLTNLLDITSGDFSHAKSIGYVSSSNADHLLEEDVLNMIGDPENLTDPGQRSEDYIIEGLDESEVPKELVDSLNMSGILHRGVRQLSTGELQKVMICRAIMQKPALLVFDDPYEGLDVASREHLSDIINNIDKTEMSVVLIVSRLDSILETTTHIAYMEDGTFPIQGKKEEIINSPTMKMFFDPVITMPEELPGQQRINSVNTDENENVISLQNTSVNYGERKILEDFTWNVKQNQNWLITGPNGCGKTTLLSLVTGDHSQSFNNGVTLFGIKRGSGETIWDIKKNIGIVSSALQRDYKVSVSVIDMVISGFYDSIGIYSNYLQEEYNEAYKWLEIVGMQHIKDESIKTLSYGEQRLLLIIRAMVKHPPILILDEPCLGLDPINRTLILKLINYLASKTVTQIFYITHHQEDKIDCITNRLTFVEKEDELFDIVIS